MTAYVNDAVKVIEAVNSPSWVFIGHSLGGTLAVMLAAQMPHKTAGVVCIDSFKRPDRVLPESDKTTMLDFLAADWENNVKTWLVDAAFTPKTPPLIIEYIEEALSKADPEMAVESFRDLLSYSQVDLLNAIEHIPLVLFNGAPPAPGKDFFSQFHKNYRLIEFEDSGHFVMLEQSESFNKNIHQTLLEILSQHKNGEPLPS